MNNNEKEKVGLVFLPLPGMGHLIAMVELIKALLDHNPNFKITILTFSTKDPSSQLTSYISSTIKSYPNISFQPLPRIDPSLYNHASNVISTLTLIDLHKPNVKSAITTLRQTSTRVSALVVDFFCTNMLDVSKELCVSCYIFFTSSAAMLGHKMYSPTLDETLPPSNMEGLNLDGIHVHIPTFSSPVPPLALPSPYMDRGGDMYKWFLHHGRRFREAYGIIVNSYQDLETYATKALLDGKCVPDGVTPPLYFVGPLLNVGENSEVECVKWLDRQPDRSVVFLCFGSMGGFSKEQAREIAVGLERSKCRFLWVIRSAPSLSHQKEMPSQPVDVVVDDVLPDGFLERTKERGIVWPTFAPQAEILAHKATGGFVTHCGWNSCLESLWFGVPMLAWPLYAEQHLNALQMVEETEVAIKLNIDRLNDNWASSDEVERGIRCLMEEGHCEKSRKVRCNALEMKQKARNAVKGGSSFISMKSVVGMLSRV